MKKRVTFADLAATTGDAMPSECPACEGELGANEGRVGFCDTCNGVICDHCEDEIEREDGRPWCAICEAEYEAGKVTS